MRNPMAQQPPETLTYTRAGGTPGRFWVNGACSCGSRLRAESKRDATQARRNLTRQWELHVVRSHRE